MKRNSFSLLFTALVLCIGPACESRAGETTVWLKNDAEPQGDNLQVSSGGNVFVNIGSHGFWLRKEEIKEVTELVAKCEAWPKIAEENQLSDFRKVVGVIQKNEWVFFRVNNSGRLTIGDTSWEIGELKRVLKLLEQVPELDKQIEKTDRLLK